MKKIREYGRSALETLQVLALMGILSLASFFAYRYVMNRWRTNDLLQEGSRRAVVVSMRIIDGKQPDLRGGMYNDQTGGGRFDRAVIIDAENCQFGLRVFDVPDFVCKNALLMLGEQTHLRRIALEADLNTSISECTPEKGDYVLVYSSDLSTTSAGCATINILSQCTDGQFKDANGLCTSCTDSAAYETTEEECSKCADRAMKDGQCVRTACDSGLLKDADGECKPCAAETAYQVSEAECLKCPERAMKNGECVKKDCGAYRYKAKNGQCKECNDLYVSEISDEGECKSCGDKRRVIGNFCYKNCEDDWFQNNNGNCTFCGDTNAKATTQTECDKCNKEGIPFKRVYSNGSCAIVEPTCPDGYFRSADDARCKSCSEEQETHKVRNEAECTKCNKAGEPPVRFYGNNKCAPASAECPEGTYMGDNATCYSCTKYDQAISTTAYQCGKCKDSAGNNQRAMSGDYCVFAPPNPSNCGDGLFQNSNGNCTRCDFAGNGKMTSDEQCNKCNETTIFKRKTVKGLCGLDGGCPNGYFKGKQGTEWLCLACSDTGSYPIDKQADCLKCTGSETNGKRKMSNNRCVVDNS